VGVGYGVTSAMAGEKTVTASNALNVNFNYHFTPFASVTLEGQFGKLTGGDATRDAYAKQFINNYKAVMLHADLQAGELIDYSQSPALNALKNFYLGIGAGVLMNTIDSIQTVDPDPTATRSLLYAIESANFVVPLRVGYEFKVFNRYNEPQFRVDIAYTFNTVFGQGLDGYINPYSKASLKFYNYVSLGVKYSFGSTRSYRKDVGYATF
jgi:hypothetical protein